MTEVKEQKQILVEVVQYQNGMSAKCKVSDPITSIKLIQVLGELRDDLLEQIDDFLDDLMENHDLPEDIKTLLEKRKVSSELIEIIKKIRTMDNPEEREQLMKDIEGVIKGQ